MDFDERAATWDDDNDPRARRTRALADAIRAALGDEHRQRGLDFGAGTGTLSLLLSDLFDEIVLVDTAPAMLAVAAEKAGTAALGARLTPLVVDLTDPAVDRTALPPVDVAWATMSLHHIADVPALLRTFRGLLVPGGLLLLADLVAEDGSFHAHLDDFDGHDGFERDELTGMLTDAGFAVLSYGTAHVMRKSVGDVERAFPIFLAVARRP